MTSGPTGPLEPTLFNTDTYQPKPCRVPHCGAIRLSGQEGRIPTCQHDLDPHTRRRPKNCLNTHNPSTAEIPF